MIFLGDAATLGFVDGFISGIGFVVLVGMLGHFIISGISRE